MLFPDHESTASLSGSKPSWMDEWCPDALHLPKLASQFENNSIWRASGCFTEIQLLGYLSPNDFLFIVSNTEEQPGDVVANNKIQNRVLRSHKGKCLGGWLQGTHASRTLMNFAATGEKGIISSDGNEAKQIHDDSCISEYFCDSSPISPSPSGLRVLSCFFHPNGIVMAGIMAWWSSQQPWQASVLSSHLHLVNESTGISREFPMFFHHGKPNHENHPWNRLVGGFNLPIATYQWWWFFWWFNDG